MTTPGLKFPTQQAMIGNSARDSARLSMQNANQEQAEANKLMSGGQGNQIAVPQMQMGYKPTGGPGTDPNSQITGLSKLSTQSVANAELDKVGGSRSKKIKGGNPDWHWGCKSGGKARHTKRRHTKARHSKARHTKRKGTRKGKRTRKD